jgi:hypothetical protein
MSLGSHSVDSHDDHLRLPEYGQDLLFHLPFGTKGKDVCEAEDEVQKEPS